MVRVLVSACLSGEKCNYKAQDNYRHVVDQLENHPDVEVFKYCPESFALPTPREPANIMGTDGAGVLASEGRVLTHSGREVTEEFIAGARSMLAYAQKNQVEVAFLKEKSPSCGVKQVYDGVTWPEKKVRQGRGVAAELLFSEGIELISDEEEAALRSFLQKRGIYLT